MLRRILGERAKDRLYILTAHNKGFRLACPVRALAPAMQEPAPQTEIRDTPKLRGGFEVLAAEDSEKGCRLAATEHPDVILMDLEMPDDDRWEAVRRLKNDPQTQDIPIIGMSAHAVESEREKAIATGCDEFDAKPIEFESLVATIRRVLAPHK